MNQIFQSLIFIVFRIVGFVVPRAETQEAGCDHGLFIAIGKLIARQLLAHELIVRHVTVERVNHPVAILPRERLDLIAFVTTRLREPNNIQPMSSPAFPEMRTGQKLVYQLCGGFRVLRGVHEILYLFRRRRQSGYVPIQPLKQCASISFRRCGESLLTKFDGNKSVDRVCIVWHAFHNRRRKFFQRLKRPPVAPASNIRGLFVEIELAVGGKCGTISSPASQDLNFSVRQLLAFAMFQRWHFSRDDSFEQSTFC